MKKLIVSALLCASSLSFAGDAAKLTHVGASADGKSFAFMESGVHDGMGNAFARIRVLDTLSNKFAAPVIERVQSEEEMENASINQASVEADVLKRAQEVFKKLNISTSIKGDVVASRKITDLEARKLKELSFSTSPIIGGYSSPTYKIKLTQSAATPASGVACMDPSLVQKVKIELVNSQTKKVSTLQADATLPASRGCVHSYEIEDVVVLEGKVVVLLRIFTDGFEGEDVRYMSVSGALN